MRHSSCDSSLLGMRQNSAQALLLAEKVREQASAVPAATSC